MAEAWTSNMVDWKFCSSSIFEINITLLYYEILEKLVTLMWLKFDESLKIERLNHHL